MGLKNKISPGYLYFLTCTVVDWVDIFTKPGYKHIIIESLAHCQLEKGLEIYAWCLMSNHLHMVASAGPEGNLSDILRDFKQYTSKQIVKKIQAEHKSRKEWILMRFKYAAEFHRKTLNYKVWQDGNEPKEIHTNDFLQQKIDYIHNNPVVAEYVNEPEEYRYSSARDYAGKQGLLKVILAD